MLVSLNSSSSSNTDSTQQLVTNLSIDLSAKTSQADILQALTAFSAKSWSAIFTACTLLDGHLRPSITANNNKKYNNNNNNNTAN